MKPMKQMRLRLSSAIVVAIVALIWNLLVFTLSKEENRLFYFWAGYTFAMIAFVVTAAVMVFVKGDKDASINSRTPALLFTGVYFIVSLLLNTIFICIPKDEPRLVVMLLNVIIILVYAAAMVYALYVTGRIAAVDKALYGGAAILDGLAVQITGMIDLCENAEIKNELTILRDAVHTSNIMGIPETKELETRFRTQVVEIQGMIDEEVEAADILKKIKSAKVTLKSRNAMLSMTPH